MTTERTLADALAEIREEIKNFLQTRLQIFRAETREKLRSWKRPLTMMALAVVFLVTGWLACAFAFVALLHSWIAAGSYAWFWGGLIAGAIFLVAGVTLGRAGYRSIKTSQLAPERTLRVLKQDQTWIRDRVKSA